MRQLFPRRNHINPSPLETDVPDGVTFVRMEWRRHCSASPTNWTSHTDTMSWAVEQQAPGGEWIFLGESTTKGGVMLDPQTGAEEPISWDETKLLAGSNRRVRITLRVHESPVDTEGNITWL